jgi:DNA polymerase-4
MIFAAHSADKNIIHMDLDAFFVSVERLKNPKLNGIPLLIGGSSNRGVVAACSYEARTFGIHSAMPMRTARRLCPHATVIGGDSEQYSYYSGLVTDIIAEQVPLYEKSSIDEFYIDLSGMERFFSSFLLAKKIRKDIKRETGLPISFGHSVNKTVSKVATNESKPNGYHKVERGAEKVFLSPLTVNKIPQVGERTSYLLRNMGVVRVKTLQQMPVELMENVLGKNGRSIWLKAQGVDHSQVVPYSEQKSMSSERTFNRDTTDVHQLRNILIAMTERLAFKLRKQQKLTACLTVKIRYSDFNTYTLQCRMPYTSCDHLLIAKAKELFDKLYQRRLLIRLIGVRFSHLVGGGYQISLLDDTEEMINLYQAMDRMRLRFGEDKIKRAAGMQVKHRSMNPFNGVST